MCYMLDGFKETHMLPQRNTARGVSRIFIIGFPTSGLGRYFNRGGEATSDTQLNLGNLNSVCAGGLMQTHNSIYKIKFKVHPYLFYMFLTNFILATAVYAAYSLLK